MDDFREKPRKTFAQSVASDLITRAGITEPPVSLKRIIDYLQGDSNIQVMMYNTGEKISGFIAYDYDEDIEYAVIAINDNHGWFRKRFTIAHEIGHFLLDHKSSQIPDYLKESEANTFAAELLMPKKFLSTDCKIKKLSISQLKERYRVNNAVIYIKMESDRLIKKYLGL